MAFGAFNGVFLCRVVLAIHKRSVEVAFPNGAGSTAAGALGFHIFLV